MEAELLDPKDARTAVHDTPATRSTRALRLEGARPTRTGELLDPTIHAQFDPLASMSLLPLN